MKGLRTALCLVVILVAATGFAQKITTDWDHGTDFTKYKTYTYAKGTPVEDPLMDQRVVDAIDAALAKEGIKKVDSNPDMYVTYHASAKENKQYVTDNFGYGYGARWGGGMGTSTTRAYTYEKGTIVIDLWSADGKQLLFRGSGTDTISDKPDKNIKKIHKVVEKIFDKYPPKSS